MGGHRLRSAAGQGAPGQHGRRVVRPLPAAQVADYEALRAAGRTARLTIGPWTHASPGLFAETVRDGPEWFEEQLGDRTGLESRAPVRVFVMGSRTWQEFSLWPPAGEAQEWYLGGGARSTPRPGRERSRPVPLQPARPDAGPRRSVAQRPHGGPQGPAPARAPPRRADLHQPGALRGPHGHRPVDGVAVPALVARAHGLLRAAVRRLGKGPVRNLSDGIVRLAPGSVEKEHDGVFRLDVAMWPTANTFPPATGSGSRSRAVPTRSSAATPAAASRSPRASPCARRTRRSSTTPPVPHVSRCPSCGCWLTSLSETVAGGSMGDPGLTSRA